MLSSTHFPASQSSNISFFRRTMRAQPTNYIFNQQHNDRQMLKILQMLTQYNSLVELKQMEKGKKVCQAMQKQMYKINVKYRSYYRVCNLVFWAKCLIAIAEGDLGKAEEYLMDQENLCYSIDSPQYTAKSCLLYLSYLLKSNQLKHEPTTLQPLPPSSSSNNLSLQSQIKQTYRKFSKIKFPTNMQYYDYRIWQDIKIIQIVVYQYILVVQLLGDLKYQRINVLYQCGLKIAKRLLGKGHNLVELLKKIKKIRKNTDDLVRMGDMYGSSVLLSHNSSKRVRPKTLIQPRGNKINNPQKYGYAFSRTYTETSQLVSNADISKSESINPNTNGKSLKSKSKYNMYLQVGKNLKQKSTVYLPKKTQHSSSISQKPNSQRNDSTIKDKDKDKSIKTENNVQNILDKKLNGNVYGLQSNIYLPRINENISKRKHNKKQGKNKKDQKIQDISISKSKSKQKVQKKQQMKQSDIFKPRISYLMQSEVQIDGKVDKSKKSKDQQQDQKDMSCQMI